MINNLPPVIRVFISSTFADMGRERQYFNTVVVPRLNRLCSERGISFFSVDLRWGITEEDQVNGKVIPICLREIDNCRPFFIGILGRRYGSILNDMAVSSNTIPWLNEMKDKSVTEIEMYYGVFQNESSRKTPDCLFLFQSDELADQINLAREPEENQLKLQSLKTAIRENRNIPSFDYNSMEEFGNHIIASVSSWLDQKFPSTESVHEARRKWYNSELLRDYIRIQSAESFLDNYCGSSSRSLMIYGSGKSGKTTALSAWQPKEGKKILINCASDEQYQYWPAAAHEIINKLDEIDENVGFPEFEAYASLFFRLTDGHNKAPDEREHTMYYVTDEERNSFRKGFVRWLKSVKPCEPVYIVINDLNYLTDSEAAYLGWLPERTSENVHLICSVKDRAIADNAAMLGWNLKEMPVFSDEEAVQFLDQYLAVFGKNMSTAQKKNLLQSPLLRYPGNLKFIIQYFNNYGNFENLDELSSAVSVMTTEQELYNFILNRLLKTLSAKEQEAAQTALVLLAETTLGLSEDALFTMVNEMIPVDAISWSKIRLIFEQFQIISADTWKIWDTSLKEALTSLPVDRRQIHRSLGRSFFHQMDQTVALNSAGIRKNTDLAEAAVFHLSEAQAWDELLEILKDRNVLYYLTKMEWKTVRSAFMRMIIFSDIDVSGKIMEIFEKCDSEYTGIEGIQQRLIGLMVDLELNDISEKASKQSGIPPRSDLRAANNMDISDENAEVYNRFHQLKEDRRFLRLLLEISHFLDLNGDTLTANEKCLFYMLKADCEMQIENYPDALKTTYEWYTAAVSSQNEYEIMRSVLNRAALMLKEEKPMEAREYIDYAQNLALDLGSLRDYAAAANLLGMALYRTEQYDESVEQFELCMHTWKRIDNDRELINCWLNKSNALHLRGDTAAAAAELEKMYSYTESLKRDDFTGLSVRILDNLGSHYDELGKKDSAEAIFIKAKTLARNLNDVPSNTYLNLINFYKKYQQPARAVEVYRELCDSLYERRMYAALADVFRDCLELMRTARYTREAEEFEEYWEKKFSALPGGRELFEKEFRQPDDQFARGRLKETLVVAKNEHDYHKTGTILLKLAEAAEDSEKPSLLIEAIENFKQADDNDKALDCACKAVRSMIHNGFDDSRFEKVCSFFDESGRKVIDLWLSLDQRSASKEDYALAIRQILDLSSKQERLCAYCLIDEFKNVIELLPVEVTVKTAQFLKDSSLTFEFNEAINRFVLENASGELSFLMRNYAGTKADNLLEIYENKIAVLEVMDNPDAGVLAGNIALIYRRRLDEAETLSHHIKAAEIFERHGKVRDMFIEKMNIATAYQQFGDNDRMIESLRSALKDPDISSCPDVQASIAGNLAAALMKTGKDEAYDEIISCFDAEESYFRKSGDDRELVISLLNQLHFHLVSGKADPQVLKEKYLLAEKITNEHRLNEFVQDLRRLRPMIFKEKETPKQKNSFFSRFLKKKTSKNARSILESLVDDSSDFEISETDDETESHIHALLFTKMDLPGVRTNLHLWINNEDECSLRYLFVIQPAKIHDKMDMYIQQYIEWWNRQNFYALDHDENGGEDLILCHGETGGSPEEIKKDLALLQRLWILDAMNMTLAVMDMFDLEEFGRVKQKALNKLS